jgi:hypothetical protein
MSGTSYTGAIECSPLPRLLRAESHKGSGMRRYVVLDLAQVGQHGLGDIARPLGHHRSPSRETVGTTRISLRNLDRAVAAIGSAAQDPDNQAIADALVAAIDKHEAPWTASAIP